MSTIKYPSSLKRVSSLSNKPSVVGLGCYALLSIVMLFALMWCYNTAGEPYEEARLQWAAIKEDTWDDFDGEANSAVFDDEFDSNMDIDVTLKSKDTKTDVASQDIDVMPHPMMPDFWAILFFGFWSTICILFWFMQRWSIAFHAMIRYTRSSKLSNSSFVYVIPHAHQGNAAIVPIMSQPIEGMVQYYFMFQRERFEVDISTQTITRLRCPVNLPIAEYILSEGHLTENSLKANILRFGKNNLALPIPTIYELYFRQIQGPVPVFQLFSSCLWLLDTYWNYALYQIAFIFIFEGTTAFQRQKNMKTLRGMQAEAGKVFIYRGKKWILCSTEDLLPGDLFSIAKNNKDDVVIPCDSVLVHGSAVVNEATMTGESTPQMKEALVMDSKDNQIPLDMVNLHKVHILFSGTSMNQHSHGVVHENQTIPEKYSPPDNGCICYCLRTGFSSSQGALVRMIEFSSEKVMSDVKETIALLMLLLAFALMASGYVLKKGLEEGTRTKYDLILRCVLIITSVVPPELPMQTAVAVNTALMALHKAQVFCTEPFRIPYAGRVSKALFDKTGTLTTDKLVFNSLACVKNGIFQSETDIKSACEDAIVVMGGCHSLIEVDGEIMGDPIEVTSMKVLHWHYDADEQIAFPGEEKKTDKKNEKKDDDKKKAVKFTDKNKLHIQIVHRYHFASKLQRMSVLGKVYNLNNNKPMEYRVLVKGSPEAVGALLKTKPNEYDSTYRKMAENGVRVLALAYRTCTNEEVSDISSLSREELEKDLIFVGFLGFNCQIRRDTSLVMSQLQGGSVSTVMVTGDAALTALHVAGEIGVTQPSADAKALLLTQVNDDLMWVPARPFLENVPESVKYNPKDVPALVKAGFDLCMTGKTLNLAVEQAETATDDILEFIKIFARMAPVDKEHVLRALKERGYYTLMCGDGANDVGALKQAHIGLALLAGFGSANTVKSGEKTSKDETPEERKEREKQNLEKQKQRGILMKQEIEKDKEDMKRLQQEYYLEEVKKLEAQGDSWAALKGMKNSVSRVMAEQKRRAAERKEKYGVNSIAAQAAFMSEDMDTGEVPALKVGDASVAAPFTSKLPSVKSCVDLIRQGRCTLVSTIQQQQIMALNCLIAAYSLSALYLDGVRSGEKQMIASGILLMTASISFSYARPVDQLSPVLPITTIFHPAIWTSTFGQLVIHLACMVYSINLSSEYATAMGEDDERFARPVYHEPEFDEDGNEIYHFTPTLLNTVVFLVQTAQQVAVMAVNYKGRPFMLASTENRPMLYSLLLCCVGIFVAAFEVVPELNEYLELVPLPNAYFRNTILITLSISVFGSFLWDRLMQFIFSRELLIVGMQDAWKNIPTMKDNMELFKKIGIYGGAGLAVLLLDIPPILLLGAWWYYRKTKAKEETPTAPM